MFMTIIFGLYAKYPGYVGRLYATYAYSLGLYSVVQTQAPRRAATGPRTTKLKAPSLGRAHRKHRFRHLALEGDHHLASSTCNLLAGNPQDVPTLTPYP